MTINPSHSSEPVSKVEITTSDRHVSGVITVLTNANTYDSSEYALIVITR